MEGYAFFYQLNEIYKLKNYRLASQSKVQELIKQGEIEAKEENGLTYISIKSFETFLKKIELFREDHISIREFVCSLTGNENPRVNISSVKNLVEQTCLEMINFDNHIYGKQKNWIKKSSYFQFQQDYISISEAFNELNIYSDISHFKDSLIKRKIRIFLFQKKYEHMYVKKVDLIVLKNKIGVKDAMGDLKLSPHNFYAAIKEYNIEIFKGRNQKTYIQREDFQFLKDSQIKACNELLQKTYTYDEVTKLYNDYGAVKGNDVVLKKYTFSAEIPHLARIDKYKGRTTLYYKAEMDNYLYELTKEKEIIKLCDVTTNDFHLLFREILKIKNVVFKAPITKKLWFQYVDWKLKKMNGNRTSCIRRVVDLSKITKIFVDFIGSKEISEFSEKELNLGLFNNHVSFNHRKELRSFLFNITQNSEQRFGKRIFDLSKINFKHSNNSKGIKEKEIYSVEEYLSLNNYVSDYDTHKRLAIEDIKKGLTNSKEYKKYDSMWLYVLLHMNNGWRNGTVLEFPRFHSSSFDELNINTIESLENLKLTYSDAVKIVSFYQVQWFEHNKTKEKATFYCSSLLTLPMAYAILICEFRCRKLHLDDESNLIHFYTKENRVSSSSHDTFFKNHSHDFRFESRKMNRTVLTYTSSVIESTLDSDPVTIAQHLRGHVSRETSNIYIQLPPEHLDFIMGQLFDTGYFGFIYSQLNHFLIGESPVSRIEQTKKSIELRALFGDIVKLEDTTAYLNYLSQEREDLGKLFEEMPKEELKKKLNLINLGLSPAKEQTYQCLFSKCISNEIECSNCPFSIPHFYTISVIAKRIKRTLIKYKDIARKADIPLGEKNKLYNLLLRDYTSIMEAKRKFGEEIIVMLINNELNNLINELEEQPDPENLHFID